MENENKDIIDAEFTVQGEENLPAIIKNNTIVDMEFEYARANIINILQTSNKVLESTADLVMETEHPQMVQVYSGLIKTLIDVNKSLFELREKKMLIKGELADVEEVPTGTTINNNAIFIGSTEELLKRMKG